jgi:hypothetical protein
MEQTFQPYSDPANLEAIRAISREVIHEVEPEEDISVKRLGDRLVKGCEEGKLTVATSDAENAGGFGDIDLVTLVVIPLVVVTLGEVCKQLVIWSVTELKEWAKKDKDNKKKVSDMIDVVVEQKYEEVSGKVKSQKSRAKGKNIRSSVKVRVKRHLEVQ